MSVENEPTPPAPITVDITVKDAEGKFERFAPAWISWFNLLKVKATAINGNLIAIANLVGQGFATRIADGLWALRTITGTAQEIDVDDGAGTTGNPRIGLADLPDAGGGAFRIITRDAKGRISGSTLGTAADVPVASLSGATYNNLQQFLNTMNSPGIILGGTISDLGSGNIRVAAGTMMIRIADDDVSTLPFADFAQADFVVPADQATRFFGVVYNSGSPIVEMRTVFDWNKDTEIPLGSCVRFNGTTVVLTNPYRTGDPITNIIQRFDAIGPAQRDNSVGGLILAEVPTRTVTVTAGRIWSRLIDHTVFAKNSSVDSMISGFFNGAGLTLATGVTQWDNAQYNDTGAGTLVALDNNKYANLWFFVTTEGDQYGFIYGTDQYNTLAEASTEGIPFFLTENFFSQTLLLGRFIFQEGASVASVVESAFTRVFTTQPVSNHNDLSGLQGGTTDEYYHLTAAQHTKIAQIGNLSDPNVDRGLFWDDSAGSYAYFSTGTGVAFNGTVLELNTTLTALAGTSWAANALAIGSGAGTVAQVAFAANTFPARGSTGNLVAKTITDDALALLSDADVPRIGTPNTWTSAQTINSNASPGSVPAPQAGTLLHLAQADAANTRQTMASFGAFCSINGVRANGTAPAPTALVNVDNVMAVGAAGYDGAAYTTARANFVFRANENWSTTAHGTRWVLFLTPNGSTTLEIAYNATTDSLFPGNDNGRSLGLSGNRWSVVYAGTGAINTSDAREKTPVRPFTDAEIAAAQSLSDEVGFFQFLDAREVKGEFARDHCGLTVQRAIEVMEAHGLDPFSYGFICYDRWDEQPEMRDQETGEITREYSPAGDRFSFRPDQLDRFIAKGIRENQKRIEARLNYLETL